MEVVDPDEASATDSSHHFSSPSCGLNNRNTRVRKTLWLSPLANIRLTSDENHSWGATVNETNPCEPPALAGGATLLWHAAESYSPRNGTDSARLPSNFTAVFSPARMRISLSSISRFSPTLYAARTRSG